MNLNNFTIKAAEAIQSAQQLAFNLQNPNIETEHILKALLDQEDSTVDYLLKKNNVTVNLVESKLTEALNKLPKVSGGEPAQAVSREANNVVLRAGSILKQFGDEFVAPEHLLLAIIHGSDQTAKLLKDAGLNEKTRGAGRAFAGPIESRHGSLRPLRPRLRLVWGRRRMLG